KAASWRTRLTSVLGKLVIPIVVVVLQIWSVQHVMERRDGPLRDDRVLYLNQAREFHNHPSVRLFINVGLYPTFLSLFNFDGIDPQEPHATKNATIVRIYEAQSVLLAVTSFFLLLRALTCIPQRGTSRIIVSILLSCILLSPMFLVWPS